MNPLSRFMARQHGFCCAEWLKPWIKKTSGFRPDRVPDRNHGTPFLPPLITVLIPVIFAGTNTTILSGKKLNWK
jgi:hypothetical protein